MAVNKFQINDSDYWSISESDFDEYFSKIITALNNDLNTPKALAELSALESFIAEFGVDKFISSKFEEFLSKIDALFGLDISKQEDLSSDIKSIIDARENARKNQDWHKADELRTELKKQGVEINDTSHGPVWSRY
jgi:cysteinyl-tRNA synthetase